MAEDCKTNEACDEQAPILGTTGNICYDGNDLSCENEPSLDTPSGSKLNNMITLIWSKLCELFGRVTTIEEEIVTINNTIISGIADGVITNVELSGNDLIFTGQDGGFNGSIPLPAFIDTNDIDYINSAVLNAGTLTLSGIGNAGAVVDLNATIDYINGGNINGTDLVLNGIGNASAVIDMQPIITQAVSQASGSGGGLLGPDGSFYVGVINPNNLSLDVFDNNGSTGGFEIDARDFVLANPENYGSKIIFGNEELPYYDNGYNFLLSTYVAPFDISNMEINLDLTLTVDNQITASDGWNSIMVMLIRESSGNLTVVDYMGGVESNADNFFQEVNPIEPLNFSLNGIVIPTILTGDKLYVKAVWMVFNGSSFELPTLRATNNDVFANII